MARPPRASLTPAERRAQILEAAIGVFTAKGYAAARIEDVAAEAGVAKGTIYLHFRDKQDLFEQLVKSLAVPVLDRVAGLAVGGDQTTREILTGVVTVFRREVLETRRREVLRLIMAEGPRFPELARFYHREVVSRGLGMLRMILERGVARGEVDPAVARHPQLALAPLIMALAWDGLFSSFDPLPLEDLLAVHVERIAGAPPAGHQP